MVKVRRGTATVWGSAMVSLALVLSACNSSPKVVAPTSTTSISTTTIVGSTPGEVVSRVTTTLENGFTFVTQVPAAAPASQLLRAAQNLSVACTVSQRELTQAAWTGPALAAKNALATSLAQIVALVANAPPNGFAAALQSDIQLTSQRLRALAHAVAT